MITIIIIIIIIPWLFGCCFASSFFGRCCVVPYPSLWCYHPSLLPSSGAPLSPSSVGWCFFASSFFGWFFWVGLLFPSLMLGGAAWPPSLGGVASGPLSFCVVLPSFSPFWWCCFLSPLLLGGVAWPPSLSGVALFPLLLRGAAFLSLLPWVGLVSLPSSVGWCCPPSPPLNGDAFPPSSVGWCCLPSPPSLSAFFCLVVLHFFSFFFGWGCFLPLFCWKVLPYLLFLWMVFLGGTTFPFSSVGWCRLASFVGCCCVLHSPFAWCCLPSPPFGGAAFSLLFSWVVLLGLLR